jgi:hypothetical protein
MNEADPPVYMWFKIYSALFAVLYLVVAIAGGGLIAAAASNPSGELNEAAFMGVIYLVVGLVLFVPFVIAPFLPKKPWVWIFDLVLICVGLTSPCCMIASIPLLIFWIKPEAKALFGRGTE